MNPKATYLQPVRPSAHCLRAGLLLAATQGFGCDHPAPARDPLLVAAAADLAGAFGDLSTAWLHMGHRRPAVTYGASGMLATQIAQGAPFDAFASANVGYVNEVVRSGRCDSHTQALYARGRLALCARPGHGINTLADLAHRDITRVAIAHPDHAPYGRAAREALTHAGLWTDLYPKLVYGENVQQTLQYVTSGNADAALVSHSLAMTSGLPCVLVDDSLHGPLDQAIVACGHGPRMDEARSFVRFVASPAGRSILAGHGFVLPANGPARPVTDGGP